MNIKLLLIGLISSTILCFGGCANTVDNEIACYDGTNIPDLGNYCDVPLWKTIYDEDVGKVYAYESSEILYSSKLDNYIECLETTYNFKQLNSEPFEYESFDDSSNLFYYFFNEECLLTIAYSDKGDPPLLFVYFDTSENVKQKIKSMKN